MSAFMVEDRTINDSVAFLKSLTNTQSWILTPFVGLGYELKNMTDRERLAKDLFQLNIYGVNARYGDNQAQEFRPLNFHFKDKVSSAKRFNIIQCIKSLHCLIYQCSEGNVPESCLFKATQSVIQNLESQVVSSMAAYDRAEWG
jgi:hypothetical protein